MGQKDKTEKLLEDYNDVFADIINVLIFDGKKQVSPEALEDSQLKSQYKADDSRLHEQERDVMKYWKEEKVRLAVCGLENQTKIEEQINQFTSDFSIVANFFVNKRKNPRYVPDDKREIKHVDAVLKFLFAMTGDEDYEKLIYNKNFKKEGASMCSVAQSLKEEGKAEGENLILTLIQKLFAAGRGEEVQRVSEDAEYRMKIMREFDLK